MQRFLDTKVFFLKKRFRGKGRRGFTLIELLIVIAIMGVLAAVVVPNVGRFLGKGDTESAKTEVQNVQAAVFAVMVDNGKTSLVTPTVLASATDNMAIFPDQEVVATKKDKAGTQCALGDGIGWVLFSADVTCNSANLATDQVNYLATQTTRCKYWADAKGTVTQKGGPSGCIQ
jgi:prepilin-type N-terminal cleavage/methylation domain-containing protein